MDIYLYKSFYILMCLCHFRIKHVKLTFLYRKYFVKTLLKAALVRRL